MRDYDQPDYRAAKLEWALVVKAGEATCWRCGRPINPATEWHLGHDDQRNIVGPEHAACNLGAPRIRRKTTQRPPQRHPGGA